MEILCNKKLIYKIKILLSDHIFVILLTILIIYKTFILKSLLVHRIFTKSDEINLGKTFGIN